MKKQFADRLILSHHPTILTQDRNWAENIEMTQSTKEEGQIIILPDDAIVIVHREDQNALRFFNNPIFIYDKQK